ncbi:hypothetical protein [Treponema sp. R80B11-R83G3]
MTQEEGRTSYEKGVTLAMTTFQQASNQGFATTADPQTILLAEYTFLSQELEFLEKSDKESISSLTKAIRFFDDAFLALQIVEYKIIYNGVDKAIPHDKDYRVKGFPKDSFHIAFHSHKARLKNILKTPGLDPIEKALLKQRLVNLSAGQNGYVELQRKTLQEKKEK